MCMCTRCNNEFKESDTENYYNALKEEAYMCGDILCPNYLENLLKFHVEQKEFTDITGRLYS